MSYAYTRPRYKVNVYRTIGPLVSSCFYLFIYYYYLFILGVGWGEERVLEVWVMIK